MISQEVLKSMVLIAFVIVFEDLRKKRENTHD